MNKVHRIAVIGFAAAGLALAGPAAMADTIHGQSSDVAGPGGASSTDLFSGAFNGDWGRGHHHHGGGKVIYVKKTQTAGPGGATSSKVFSAAD
ncbi:hypothetical protein ACGFNU_33365 [Spirillospora sp. NPDC048911]|uniref:hypothetical protein n=1 Tax=Spirillospora sp. NPDC048911 TaxID=3364527 RepID=UPI003716ECA9